MNQVLRKKRTNKEFRLSAQIGEYDMDNVILDLGSDVNVLPRQTWEMMGKPKLVWSTVQLRLENQHKIIPIRRLVGVLVNIDGVHNIADFEVIEIVDNSQSYPTLLGLDWAFDNQAIINLKKREMIFEGGGLKVTTPLDPTEARRYVEPTRKEIDNLYNMTTCMDDYVNPTADGALSWRSISSCASDSEEGLEHWKHRLHKVSTRRCARITRSLHWIRTEVHDTPKFDGLTKVSSFVNEFEL
jgi:hypothetical protein